MSVCVNYKCYIYVFMMKLTLLKGLVLIKQVHQTSVAFVTIAILDKGINFEPNVCNDCPDVLMISMNLSVIAILKIDDCHCIINGISKK